MWRRILVVFIGCFSVFPIAWRLYIFSLAGGGSGSSLATLRVELIHKRLAVFVFLRVFFFIISSLLIVKEGNIDRAFDFASRVTRKR